MSATNNTRRFGSQLQNGAPVLAPCQKQCPHHCMGLIDAGALVDGTELGTSELDMKGFLQRMNEDFSDKFSKLAAENAILNSKISEQNAENVKKVANLDSKISELQVKETLQAAAMTALQGQNAELQVKETLQAAMTSLQGDMRTLQNETHALCLDKAMIYNAQIILRFLGRQDRSHTVMGYVRQAFDNKLNRDPQARDKVVVMLSKGLQVGETDLPQQEMTVDLLDEILNDRNGVAHPEDTACHGMVMDVVIKNLEHFKTSNAISPKEELILLILQHRRDIGDVQRLKLLDGVS